MKPTELIANYVCLFMLLALTANALVANWTLNPIWDLLYARVESTFFHNVHASSMLSVGIAGMFLIGKARGKNIPLWVVVVFGTASIHEMTLATVDLAIGHQLPQTVSLQYAFYLSVFLVLSLWKGTNFQRRILGAQFFVVCIFYGMDLIVHPGSTIVGSAPSQFFNNPLTNAVEVSSWIVPVALWFLPQRWVESWALLPARS